MANDRGAEGAEDAARRDASRPGLPYAKAFVVHFTAESDVRLERAAGRVEHLQSGRRARFASTAELLACIVALLSDVGREPTSQAGPTSGGALDRDRKVEPGAKGALPSP